MEKYYGKCRNEINVGENFSTKFGEDNSATSNVLGQDQQLVYEQQVINNQISENTNQEIIGIFDGVSLPKTTCSVYNIYLTNKEIIGDLVCGTRAAFLAFGAIGAAVVINGARKKAYKKIVNDKPEQIFARHKRNFSINYEDIKSIKFMKSFSRGVQIKLKKRQPNVGKKFVLGFSKNQLGAVESLLIRILQNYSVKIC